jgi:hypothetical protein
MAAELQRDTIDGAESAVRANWEAFVRARDGHRDYVDRAVKYSRFYEGDQWARRDIDKLRRQGRPWLTINLILSTINTVLGEQRSKRIDFRFKSKQGGEEATAMVLTKLMQAIKDANRFDWVESDVFEDGCIEERGYFDLRMNFDENIMGDLAIRAVDPRNILPDPDAKHYEVETWKSVIETRWLSLDEIEAAYGTRKREELESFGHSATRLDPDSIMWEGDTFNNDDAVESGRPGASTEAYDGTNTSPATLPHPTDKTEGRAIRQVRVIDRQHKRLVPVLRFVDPVEGDTKRVPPTWDDDRAREFAEKHDLILMRTMAERVRWTTSADKVLLHDDWSPYATLTIVPYFPYFRRGRPFGIVTNLISPQEQLNKLVSQELHIVNSTANSGWAVEQGSLVGMTADELRNQGAETGIVIEYRRGATPPEKIKPNTAPTGIERAAMRSASFFKEIGGVNDALLGNTDPEISGVALERNELRGQVQLQVPFDNLQRTRTMIANKMLELVQQFYVEERIFSVTTEGMNLENPKDEQFIINHVDGAGDIVNDITVGKYEVSLASMPARDSFDDVQFAAMMNMRGVGVAIPDDRVIEVSPLFRKDEIAEEVRKLQGRGELTEEQLRIMQFNQEMTLRMFAAEVAGAEAEVRRIEAESARLAAEAQQKFGGEDSPEMRLERDKLDNALQIARENLRLRQQLAELSALSRVDSQALGIRGTLANTDRKAEHDLRETVTTKSFDLAAAARKPKTE